jgi:shikimate dehydrogenase
MRNEDVSPVAPDGERYLVGLVGAGVGTSPSPRLYGREADELGLQCLDQLAVIDELGVLAAALGAVHTVPWPVAG